jgi:septal ring factor EnvC (AmiA/AmiB activator)
MRQNADLALRSAAEKGKQEEVTRRELQQALESVSSRETSSNATLSNLRNEKAALERRVRELEANLQQVISAATPKRRRGHARSSSFSDVRITTLERDLGESQASVMELRAELSKAQEKARRTEENLFRVENERTVLERRTADEMKNMQEMLASKDEEMMRLLGGVDVGLAQEREEELIRRVEEEEAKVLALERLLSESRDLKTVESALEKAEKRLAAEISKAKGLEEKNAGLHKDVKRVQDALEESRTHAQSLNSALDDRASLVHSLQAQERYGSDFSLSDALSYRCRALRAQVNAQQMEIRSLGATESIGSFI